MDLVSGMISKWLLLYYLIWVMFKIPTIKWFWSVQSNNDLCLTRMFRNIQEFNIQCI
jgi:hypothetical protein